jgi:hypothetical protein
MIDCGALAPFPRAASYYREGYFARREKHGRMEGWANLDKFRNSVLLSDRALDFGCGDRRWFQAEAIGRRPDKNRD